MPHPCPRHFAILTLAVLCAVLLPVSAQAQLSRVGATSALIEGAPVARGTDTAYDPVNNVFLVVHAYGTVKGAFVNAAGTPLTPAFTISAKSGAWAHYPRVTYGGGKFVVAWHENEGPVNAVHARTVAYASPTLGAEVSLGVSSPSGSFWEAAPGIAYSPTSQTYLVVWQTYLSYQVHGIRLDANGRKIGSMFLISSGGASSRDPNVVWNPNTNEFGVSYSGWNSASATVHFARVRPSDGAVLSRTLIATPANAYITDIAFSNATGNYVMAYSEGTTRTAEISPAGQLVAHRLTASPVGGYDGLSLAYNPASGTILLAGHYTFQVGGLELNNRGAAMSSPRELTASGARTGSFYPQVAAATNARLWSVSFSLDLARAAQQSIGSGSVAIPAARPVPAGLGTVASGSTGGTSAPPPSTGCSTPSPGTGWGCVNGGWLPPGFPGNPLNGSPAPAPTPTPTPIQPAPTTSVPCAGSAPVAGWVCVNGGWLPANHPLALSAGNTGGSVSAPAPTAPTCGGVQQPSGSWACVNGGWVPTSHPSAPLPACTGAQLNGRPNVGWFRLAGGGWVDPYSPLAKQAVCRG